MDSLEKTLEDKIVQLQNKAKEIEANSILNMKNLSVIDGAIQAYRDVVSIVSVSLKTEETSKIGESNG